VQGYVRGGMAAWIDAGLPHTTLTQISVHQLQQQLEGNGLNVLDVRSDVEWDDGHIEDAHHMHYKDLPHETDALDLAPETAVAVICASGQRSSTAGSLLQRHGFEHVHNVTGGMNAWQAAGLPVVDGQ
jgi:hydroxyacylglutathione hydrolase